jgi:nucleotidyltransferase substrate binding protein (TIGR01987 family)
MKKYDNYTSHLKVLQKAPAQDISNEFIVSGIIDKFTIQFELGWKALKELLIYEGVSAGKTGSPREIIKAAYKCFDFIDEEIWLTMLKERNNTSHIYDGKAAEKLAAEIIEKFIPAFEEVKEGIEKQYGVNLQELEDNN